MKGPEAFGLFVVGLGMGLVIGLVTSITHYQTLRQDRESRAIESGDAQYHPTTGKFMFNGELKAEKNE